MICIVIVNYKSEERTIQYVKEELSKITLSHKILIVNNGATQASNEALAVALDGKVCNISDEVVVPSDVYIISNSENSGFAKGNNIGVRFALKHFKVEYFLFSNNDIKFIDDDVVERLVKRIDEIPEAGLIGPKVIGLRGEYQSPEPFVSFWDRMVWMYLSTPFYSKEKKRERFQLDYSEKAEEGFHYKLMGSFFLVRNADFVKCGMFDEHTFLYAEENILTERMKRIGRKPYYYPEVGVIHDHGATTKKHLKKNKGNKIQEESLCYYYQEYIKVPAIEILLGKFIYSVISYLKFR